MPGSFEQIRATTAELLRKRSSAAPRISLVMAVSRRNLDQVEAFQQVAQSWGVDGAGYLPHHDFVASEAPLSTAEQQPLRESLRRIEGRADNSPGYLRSIPGFLGGQAMPQACSAPEAHLAIDPEGIRYPCVPMMTLTRGGQPEGSTAKPVVKPRDREEVCQRCWWNCHRELDLSVGRLKP
jgi:hypothetical protein